MSLDYVFIGDKGEIKSKKQAEADESYITILAVRDSETKVVQAVPWQDGRASRHVPLQVVQGDSSQALAIIAERRQMS